MLVLSRKLKEVIAIGNDIRITVLGVCGRTVRIGIEAPLLVPVHRGEVLRRISDVHLPVD